MKKDIEKIEDTIEAWEDGSLGRDEAFVKVSSELSEDQINSSVGLKLISIRLQESLIEDLKLVAKLNGIGYQPLMRQVLNRFVNSEKKILLQEVASKVVNNEREELHVGTEMQKQAIG